MHTYICNPALILDAINHDESFDSTKLYKYTFHSINWVFLCMKIYSCFFNFGMVFLQVKYDHVWGLWRLKDQKPTIK